jgi:hypothetical protein
MRRDAYVKKESQENSAFGPRHFAFGLLIKRAAGKRAGGE